MVQTTIIEPPKIWSVAIVDDSGNLTQIYDGPEPTEGLYQLFETPDERSAAFPIIAAEAASWAINKAKDAIDVGSGVNIATAHAEKTEEARRVKFDGIDVTDPVIIEQLVYLVPESVSRNITIEAMADIVWDKHKEAAALDNVRIAAKLAV